MTRFIFFYEHKLLDGGGGGIRHLDRLVLGSILMMIISSPFLEILWIINTEYTMEIEDVFLCIGYIYTYQCDLLPIKSNTLKSNFNGLLFIYLLMNVWISFVSVFT